MDRRRPALRRGARPEPAELEGRARRRRSPPCRNMHGFFAALTRRATARGWLALWTLRLDGRLVAMEYQLRHDGRVNALRADFDPALREVSPGSALNFAIARALFERGGVHEYDMGPGLNDYKLRWATGNHEAVRTSWSIGPPPTGGCSISSTRGCGPSSTASGSGWDEPARRRRASRPAAARRGRAAPGDGRPSARRGRRRSPSTSGSVGFLTGAGGKAPKRYEAAIAAADLDLVNLQELRGPHRPQRRMRGARAPVRARGLAGAAAAPARAPSRSPSGIRVRTRSGSAWTTSGSSSSTTRRRRRAWPSRRGRARCSRVPGVTGTVDPQAVYDYLNLRARDGAGLHLEGRAPAPRRAMS